MPFSDPVVAGSVLVRPAIQSPDYQPGVSGWSINADGTSEFVGGQFRGAVILDGGRRQLGVAVPAVLTAWTPDYVWQNLDLRYFTNGVDFFFEALVHNSNFGTDSYMRGIYTQSSGVQIIDLIDATGTVPSIKEGSDVYNTRRLQHAFRNADLLLTSSATFNVEDPTLNNTTPETWHSVALLNGWTNRGVPYAAASCKLLPTGMIAVQANLAQGATIVDGTPIIQLPAAYKPAHSATWTGGKNSGAGASFEVSNADAQIRIYGHVSGNVAQFTAQFPLGL